MAAKHGVSKIWIVATVVLLVGFGGLVYLNVVQYARTENQKSQNERTVADLQYQLQVVKDGKYVTPSPTPVSTTPPSKTLKITELGVQLTASAPLTDLTYQYQEVNGYLTANLITTSLMKTATCHPGALGQIIEHPISDKTYQAGQLVTVVGQNDYYYVAPAKPCATDPVTKNILTPGLTALTNTVLPTLTAD